MSFREYLLLAVVVVAIALVSGYFLIGNILFPAAQTTSSQKNFLLSLTDPATVPSGTTALFVTYSALQLSVSGNGSTNIQSLPGSGTVNVLDLQNASIVLAAINVPNGSKVTQIKVNISNAVITIGGKNSTVVIGEGTLTINLTNNNTVTGQRNAIIDLVPSVTAIETVDKTIYVLTPSVRAVITPENVFAGGSSNVSVGGPTPPPPKVGQKLGFSQKYNASEIFHSVTPSIKITSASINVNGNFTNVSVTVENTGNASVQLNGLMIDGSKKVYFPLPPVSMLFHMPAMVLMMPITPPSGFPQPSNYTPPPKFIITFPNGTVLNTTSVIQMPPPPTIQNTTVPPNSSSPSQPPSGSGTISGTFYMLNLIHPAYAISVNSTGALLNIEGDSVIETSTPPMPPAQNSTQQTGPQNITIPAGSVSIALPTGTTLYIQFPPGMQMPTATPPPSALSQAQNTPMGWMIFPNGTLGFPPVSLMSQTHITNAQQGSNQNVADNANQGASSVISGSAANLTVQLPEGIQIPKGYTLAAGSTFTFTISGQLTLGPASQMQSNGQAVVMQPPFAALIVGNLYNINLFGASGTHAEIGVTATK